ncbi:MAG: hypothetical protein ACRC7N_07355 [Clostridium sp.]
MSRDEIEKELGQVNLEIFKYENMEDDIKKALKISNKMDSGISQLKGKQQDKVIGLLVDGLGNQTDIVEGLKVRHKKMTEESDSMEALINKALNLINNKLNSLYNRRKSLNNKLWN